jgi:hypothetical protein
MKIRILMLSLIGLIFFNSCSSDSNSTSENLDPNTILPKKVLYDNSLDESGSYEFFYNQNKIDHIEFKSDYGSEYTTNFYFTYSGDLITEIEGLDISGNVIYDMNLTYQNNNLSQKTIDFYYYPSVSEKHHIISYTYNTNQTISVNNDIYDENNVLISNDSSIYTTLNGLTTKIYNNQIFYTSTYSPFKNIVGLDKVFIDVDSSISLSAEQPMYRDLTGLFISPKFNVLLSLRREFSFIYNEIEFPIDIRGTDPNGNSLNRNYNFIYQ